MYVAISYFLLSISLVFSQVVSEHSITLPSSPCPQVFTYNSSNRQSDRWYGEILVRADTTLSGFWIDVELDRPAQMLGNYLAEVTSSDNKDFKIQDLNRRLVRGSVTPVQIYVKFSETDLHIPKIRVIRLNGRQICPADEEENDPDVLVEPNTEYSNERGSTQSSTQNHRGQLQPSKSSHTNKGFNIGSVDSQTEHDQDRPTQSSTHINRGQNTSSKETQSAFNVGSTTQRNTHRITQPSKSNFHNTDQHRATQPTRHVTRPSTTTKEPSSIPDRTSQNERGQATQNVFVKSGHQNSQTTWNRDQLNWNDDSNKSDIDQGTQIRGGDIGKIVPEFRPEPPRSSDTNYNEGNRDSDSNIYTNRRGDEPKRGSSSSNTNRDSEDEEIFSTNRRGQNNSNRGTQTDLYSDRDSETNPNRGDIYTNNDRRTQPHRGTHNSQSGNIPNRDSDIDTYSNREPQRGNKPQYSNRDSDRETGDANWDEIPQRETQSHSNSHKYNDRQNTQDTTDYSSVDDSRRPIHRPEHTADRYEPQPITPRPISHRPDHTPLSNSNVRPSEPSSSDYYEWGVRRTTKRTRLTPPPRHNNGIADEQCGKVAIRPVALISRGTPTKSGDYPWHAAIYRPEGIDLRYICGATLVSLSTLVTAAHCVTRQSNGRPVKPDSLVIYLGKHSLRRWTGNEQTATVSEIIVHHTYNHTTFQADIALLKLLTPVAYNDYVRPVCLWDSRRSSIESVVARRGTVVGWGYDEYQVVTDELMQAQMPVVTKLECIHSYPTFFSRFVTDLTYCAGSRNGTTACNGDSGGGMVFLEESLDYNEESVWRLRGIVSIGVSITDQFVCDYNHYIVFTDVAQFLPWLEDNI